MTRDHFRLAVLSSILAACGSSAPPPAAAPPPTEPTPAAAVAPQVPAEPPAKAPEPTPEEAKQAERARKLREDRAVWEAEHKAELSRWTPELHAEAKALAEKNFPSGKAAIQAAMKGKHRKPDSAQRDKYRHPAETLDFFGFKTNMTVLDVGPGDGWYTELLAPVLVKNGKYIGTSSDPNGPADQRSTFYAQRFQAFLAKAPEIYGKAQTVVIDYKDPKLGQEGTVDLVLMMREAHGLKQDNTFSTWLAEIHRALKPNGVLGVEQHRAAPDANPDESAKKGYLPEKWVIDQAEAAGFKLAAKSEINANPKDTKDYPEGVWTLPPTLSLKDKDRDKYMAIGESDRMTLKFVKTAAKSDTKAAPARK
jgi:predicted methyltransferase